MPGRRAAVACALWVSPPRLYVQPTISPGSTEPNRRPPSRLVNGSPSISSRMSPRLNPAAAAGLPSSTELISGGALNSHSDCPVFSSTLQRQSVHSIPNPNHPDGSSVKVGRGTGLTATATPAGSATSARGATAARGTPTATPTLAGGGSAPGATGSAATAGGAAWVPGRLHSPSGTISTVRSRLPLRITSDTDLPGSRLPSLRPPSPVVMRWPSMATISSPSRILPAAGDPGLTTRTTGSELKFQMRSSPSVVSVQFWHSKLEIPTVPRSSPSGHARAATPTWPSSGPADPSSSPNPTSVAPRSFMARPLISFGIPFTSSSPLLELHQEQIV